MAVGVCGDVCLWRLRRSWEGGDIHEHDIAERREQIFWRERSVHHPDPVPGCLGGRRCRWHRRDPHGGQRRLGHVPVQASDRRGGRRLRHVPQPEFCGAHREAASERADPSDGSPRALQHVDGPVDGAVRWQHGGHRPRPAHRHASPRADTSCSVAVTGCRGRRRDRPSGRSGRIDRAADNSAFDRDSVADRRPYRPGNDRPRNASSVGQRHAVADRRAFAD